MTFSTFPSYLVNNMSQSITIGKQWKIAVLVVILVIREWSTASTLTIDENKPISACENPRLYSLLNVTWIIDNFTRDFVKSSAPSSRKDSEPFEIPIGHIETKWILRIYPNGDYRKQEVVSVFLMKTTESSPNYEYSCRFCILNGKKEEKPVNFTSQPGDELGNGRGFQDFLTHEELFDDFDKYVKNSKLTIRADIKLMELERERNVTLKSSL